ncbi:alpha/beta hydrolase [Neobacillus drentensis]|uniref:alpha/beta fold hydrolase n=1 Tax=Neobacillus drentensis TaxID=220684 RepID=UPI002FFEF111
MGSYKTKKIMTGHYKTFYCEGGEENLETIIFLHGSGPGATSETNWRNILPELTDSYHVIAPDMYGFGSTDHPENPPKSFWEWTNCRVEQVLALMDNLKIDKAKLVGNSMGGYVSLNLVMSAPERFEKVLLMGSAGGEVSPTPEIGRMIGFYRNPTHSALENLTKWFVYDEKSLGEELETVLRERFDMVMRPEIRRSYLSNMFPMAPGENIIPPSALRRMDQPFLLLHGFEDRFVPKESSLSLLQHLPNAQLNLYKSCGHWIQIEKRDSFLKVLNQFFTED